MELKNIIIKPVITEKSLLDAHNNKFTFVVNRLATKRQIAEACKLFFGVNPENVRTITLRSKAHRVRNTRKVVRPMDGKKAIMLFPKGKHIGLFQQWFSIEDTKDTKK